MAEVLEVLIVYMNNNELERSNTQLWMYLNMLLKFHYPGLLQVAVHGLSDIGCMNSIVIRILGMVALLQHACGDRRKIIQIFNFIIYIYIYIKTVKPLRSLSLYIYILYSICT